MDLLPVNTRAFNPQDLPAAFGQSALGARLQYVVPLARYTSARVGGPADALLEVDSADELAQAVELLWLNDLPFVILGGGSNLLVSDAGVRGMVILNHARQIRFYETGEGPHVWAESGANFGLMARQAAQRGLAGLEWAAGIPGTLGGAVVGNAGAHDGDLAGNLELAEILQRILSVEGISVSRQQWPPDKLAFSYRSSLLKRQPGLAALLTVTLKLQAASPETVQEKLERFSAYRRRTQPPGASMGSMFKNPPGDYAGRLIDAAGLKGYRVGQAEISSLHGNFFVNLGGASARDINTLLQLARRAVSEKFGVELELEVELVGDWDGEAGAGR